MFDELRDFLLAITTPEYTDQVMATCELLTRGGMFSHEDGLMKLLSISDDVDHDQILTDIDHTIRDYLDDMLGMFNLEFDDDTPLRVLNGALESMLAIPNYGDPITLLTILQADQSDEETLCQVMGLASDCRAEDYLPVLQNHSSALLVQIEEVVGQLVQDVPATETESPIRDRLRAFIAHHPGLMVDKAIRGGASLGSSFHDLTESYQGELEKLSTNTQQLSLELVGFMLATDVPVEDLRETLLEELEDLIPSINVITKVSIEINPYIAEVQDSVKA